MDCIRATLLLMVCIIWPANANVSGQTQGHIDRQITDAKASGKTEVHEAAPLINYNRHDTLQALLADRHPFLVTVVAVVGAPDSGRDAIFTHYLLKVDGNIKESVVTPAIDTSRFSDKSAPLDAKSLYIVAKQLGGSVTEQGVKITMESPGPLLSKGGRYLLFLHPTPTGEEVVVCDGSTLRVSDGERLQMLTPSRHQGAVEQLSGKPVSDAISLMQARIGGKDK